MRQKVESILAHEPSLFINRQLIYNHPEQLFTEAGVNTIEHADFEGVERLALALGGDVASTFKVGCTPLILTLTHALVVFSIMWSIVASPREDLHFYASAL